MTSGFDPLTVRLTDQTVKPLFHPLQRPAWNLFISVMNIELPRVTLKPTRDYFYSSSLTHWLKMLQLHRVVKVALYVQTQILLDNLKIIWEVISLVEFYINSRKFKIYLENSLDMILSRQVASSWKQHPQLIWLKTLFSSSQDVVYFVFFVAESENYRFLHSVYSPSG